ncbi:conserved hypothetical protein [uncultured Defluviicoccus sp.]|uniref:Pvc16 N-terminal domain-containing protein n=1 Tax=metagenome TaxID=256318 RepID=A0A380T912_9ZZZZ|nr:conserved hypothetical protein [uncultured Defluviicoccus sp.]
MTAFAIAATTDALRGVLEQAIGANQIYVGPPITAQVATRRASLFLFHLEPNVELRNQPRLGAPPPTGPATQAAAELNALPLDLRYLITVFRTTGTGPEADPNELTTLGQIIQALHATSTLTGSRLNDQTVRLMPEHYSMEELSRVWGLFPQGAQDFYRTSIVYLASPVFVEAATFPFGPPVVSRTPRMGVSTEPPSMPARRNARESVFISAEEEE